MKWVFFVFIEKQDFIALKSRSIHWAKFQVGLILYKALIWFKPISLFNQIHILQLTKFELSVENAFNGLERSLWELSLHHNQFVEVPSSALRNLNKLKYLDLSGNQIDCIESDSFSGLGGSLVYLNLAENSIDSLPHDAFGSLPKLDTIDLSGNNIAYLDPNIFQEGMLALSKV